VVWAALAVLTFLVGALLTRWVTKVHPAVEATVDVAFDERPPLTLSLERIDPEQFNTSRYRIPVIALAAQNSVVFIVGPTTRGMTIANQAPRDMTCRVDTRVFTATSFTVIAARAERDPSTPVSVASGDGGARIAVPDALHTTLRRIPKAQGAILCTFTRPLAASPTFTQRTLTVAARNGSGAVILDVPVLENVDNVNFSGGIIVPIAGGRIRLLGGADYILAIDWADVAAEEQHDVVLVLVGGLAAIAAAMAIEAVRPFIEREAAE
jgi:hypothetical protein